MEWRGLCARSTNTATIYEHDRRTRVPFDEQGTDGRGHDRRIVYKQIDRRTVYTPFVDRRSWPCAVRRTELAFSLYELDRAAIKGWRGLCARLKMSYLTTVLAQLRVDFEINVTDFEILFRQNFCE